MKKEIITDNGIYSYEEVELVNGGEYLNPEYCKNNLLDYKKVMDKHNIRYGLMFGTLLGAIREKGFIVWDEDVDIFSLEEDRKKMLNALFHFEEYGFKVARYTFKNRCYLLSLMRDGEYIDTYFYKKILNSRVFRDNSLDAKYLNSSETIEFLGDKFPVPSNPKHVLTLFYGEDWNIPNKEGKPMNKTLERRFKNVLRSKVPSFYKLVKFLIAKK